MTDLLLGEDCRFACLYLPSFETQVFQQHFSWALQKNWVLLHEEKGEKKVLDASKVAKMLGIMKGLSLSKAEGSSQSLLFFELEKEQLETAEQRLQELAFRHSPRFFYQKEREALWLDLKGLTHLYAHPNAWGRAFLEALRASGFHGSLALSYSPFGAYVLSRFSLSKKNRDEHLLLICGKEEEEKALRQLPLSVLPLKESEETHLKLMGISSLSGLLALPFPALRRRLSKESLALLELAHKPQSLALLKWRPPTEGLKDVPDKPLKLRDTAPIKALQARIDGGSLTKVLPRKKEDSDFWGLHLVDGTQRGASTLEDCFLKLETRLGEGHLFLIARKEGFLPRQKQLQLYAFKGGTKPRSQPPFLRDKEQADFFPLVRRFLPEAKCFPKALEEALGLSQGLSQGFSNALPFHPYAYLLEGQWWQEEPFSRRYLYQQDRKGNVLWLYVDEKKGRLFQEGYLG